jgi:hypothetical protein
VGGVTCGVCAINGFTAANRPINTQRDEFISHHAFDSQCFPELQSFS